MTTYNGLPTKDVGIKANKFSTDVQSTLNQNVFLQCTWVIWNKQWWTVYSGIKECQHNISKQY